MSLQAKLEAAARIAESEQADREERLLEACADVLSEAVGAAPSVQVAVLRLSGGDEFTFAWPRELRAGNRFPAGPSLAGRALREGVLIENAVPKRPHFALYERIPREGASSAPIQRMLALPIPGGNEPLGVVQLSRVGHTPEDAGPGFIPGDAETVSAIIESLAPLLARVWTAPGP
jgi:hypothetical protein